MLQVTETETEKKLRGLRKENPNYDAMWNRIRLEADKRGSGWQEQTATPISQPTPRKRWAMPVTCTALAAVIALGVATSQGYVEQWFAPSKATPLGQSIGAQAEADGIVLKLNHVVQGMDRSYGQTEATQRMMLDLSLGGLEAEDARAAFDQASITDLDTGEKLDLAMGDFSANDSRSVEDWAASRTLNTSARVTGSFSETEGQHRYRLELSDLYTIRRVTVPIEGNVKLGEEYDVLPNRDFQMNITDIQWDRKQDLLTVKFLLNDNKPRLETQSSSTLAMDRSNMVRLYLGDQDLGPGSWTEGEKDNQAEGTYNVRGLTEEQIQDMTMKFTYTEPIQILEGPWTVDFTLDSSQVEVPTTTIPIQDASELTEATGWTLGDAQLDAYGVTIPVHRNVAETEVQSGLQDGQIVEYSGISITDGEITTSGSQDPLPHISAAGEGEKQQEFIKFSVDSIVRNQTANQKTYESWESYDFRNKPLTATFSNAWIAHVDLEHWTPLAVPTTDEQQVMATLSDGTQVEYTVYRKGTDVLVEIEVPERVSLYEGTRLRVDGQDYSFDPFPLDYGSVRNEQGFYNRVDVYRNIPEGKQFEINMLAYGTVDPSKNAKVIISK